MKKRSLLFLIGLVFSFVCLFHLETSKAQTPQETPKLFNLVAENNPTGMDGVRASISIAAVREQEIAINFDAINFETEQRLSLPLFDGQSHEAVRRDSEGFQRFASDEFTWRGKIFGEQGWSGDVVLTVKGRAMSGLIYSPGAVYEIVPQANFKHLLVQIDQSQFPKCGGGVVPEQQTGNSDANLQTSADALVSSDDGSQIDVMVVYTAPVRTALGGTTQAQAFAQQAINTTNTVYQNSGIITRLRLVQALEVSYADNGNGKAGLDWVTGDAGVAAARDAARADMVALITENATDVCGLAWIMNNVSPSFASSAFSLTQRTCAIAGLTFPHELGHNQACDHNPENGSAASQLAYPYAYGHWDATASFRTVMSYPNPCPNCPRIPYFSNPSITHNGTPIGIANQRDNTRVINNTALTISQFRDSGGGTSCSTAQMTGPTNGATIQSTTTFTWNAGSGIAEYWLYVGTTPGGNNLLNASQGTNLSRTVSNLPGGNIYVTLWSRCASTGAWTQNSYSYVVPAASQPAQMTSPVNGSTFTSATATFTWNTGTGVSQYWLDIGSAQGGTDIYSVNQGTNLSRTVSVLPTDGRLIFVRLWSLISGVWHFNDYSYRAFTSSSVAITSPPNGSTLSSTSVAFTWSAGSGVSQYWLDVRNAQGTLIYSASQGTNLSRTVDTLPSDGSQISVRLWWLAGGVWQFRDHTYLTCNGCGVGITSPVNGSTFASSSVTFNWTGGAGVSQYWLDIGNAPGGTNFYSASQGSNLSRTVSGLPTDGSTIYVRLWWVSGGAWQFKDYSYRACSGCGGGATPQMTSPVPGAILGSSSVTFNWTGNAGVTQYWLEVGNALGGYDIYGASQGTGLSRTVTGIPTDGRTIYVRLWFIINGAWSSIDYLYRTGAGGNLPAQITAPLPTSTFGSSSVTFTWNSGTGVSQYWLYLGNSLGASDLLSTNTGTSQSVNVSGLPTDGRAIYLRLWSNIGGVWYYIDYKYKASG